LPGSVEERASAFERANDVILANIDLLIAIWDGLRGGGRADTGNVVQAAVVRGLPVFVINPHSPGEPTVLMKFNSENLQRPLAEDLERKSLALYLERVLEQIVSPPASTAMRRALADAAEERPSPRKIRWEYDCLLSLFRIPRPAVQSISFLRLRDPISGHASPADDAQCPNELTAAINHFSALAQYYSNGVRSSSIMEFFVILCLAIVTTSLGWSVPLLSTVVISSQIVLNGFVLLDRQLRDLWRWQERWLDYRAIAQQLQAIKFLHMLGLGVTAPPSAQHLRKEVSWVDWYVRRWERALPPPSGQPNLEHAAWLLQDVQISQQIEYHKSTARRLGMLEKRLARTANVALIAGLLVAVTLCVSSLLTENMRSISWTPMALFMLGFCPVVATTATGIRIDADLIRVVERSALAVAALTRLKLAISSSIMNYDRISIAATEVASLMADELAEWRFILESRRIRHSQRFGLGPKPFARFPFVFKGSAARRVRV